MDFMVKRLIRMSMTFRNLAFSKAQQVHISRFCTTLYFQKDKVNQCNLKSSNDDVMLKIIQDLSPSKLLNYIDSNKHQIKHEHIVVALSSLQNFYQEKLQKSNVNLHEEIDFTKLCTCLKPQIKQLSPNEVIESLKFLQLLNVPSSNLFVMTLFQQIEDSVKLLSFENIYKISTLLIKFVPTSLSQTIDSCIKKQFLEKISKFDNKNMTEIIYASCFALENIKDCKILNLLTKSIENYQEKIEFDEALDILKLLCSIKNLSYKFNNTIQRVQNVIINNINELEYHQVLEIIKDISSQINNNHEEFYSETFIDEIIQKVIYENWNFVQGINILYYLNSIRHVQMDLLDYLSAKCYEDPTIFDLNADLLHPLVTGLALADYKPVFWDFIKEPLLNNEIPKIEHLKLCYFVLYLACLECFEPILLHKVFSTKFIISEEHQQIILKIYQIVKILYPLYNGPWPSKNLIESFKIMQYHKNQEYSLLPALEQAIGGDIYIQTNVRTTLEHYIDHVVIMNRGGYPIAINSYGTIETNKDVIYLEDLSIPPGSQIFLILYAQPEWYARNTQRMLGPYSLFIKTLESMSYTVIPVNGKMWQKMPQNEKTLYIMQAIKLKFEDDSISTTS